MILKGYKNLTYKEFKNIAELLEKGEIIIYPTETIYGIGCNALNEEAVEKVFKLKKREKKKNFIWLLKDKFMLNKFFVINDIEKQLIEKYLPGALTIILKSKNLNQEIACRISPHPFITKLFNFIDFPIISTSANISGFEYNHNLNNLIITFRNLLNLFIVDYDSFNKTSLPSTIVKVENNEIKILRQGAVNLNGISINS